MLPVVTDVGSVTPSYCIIIGILSVKNLFLKFHLHSDFTQCKVCQFQDYDEKEFRRESYFYFHKIFQRVKILILA